LYSARGSLEEIRYFILLARDLGYIEDEVYRQFEGEYESVSKMLNGLIKSLKS